MRTIQTTTRKKHWAFVFLLLLCGPWLGDVSFVVGVKRAFVPTTTYASSSSSFSWRTIAVGVRGGSTTTTTTTDNKDKQKLHTYRLQQHLYLTSRSFQLRAALLQRGLSELQHCEPSASATATDWDCALSSPHHPKSCLYSLDAPTDNHKVMAPYNTTLWISLKSLNRLRRNDPSKLEPLWHSQYSILKSWFDHASPYSIYDYSNSGFVTFLLDHPYVLKSALGGLGLLGLYGTLPLWEWMVQQLLTSRLLWHYWPHWGRFLHAGLPLQLLLGQLAFGYISGLSKKLYNTVHHNLVEIECDILDANVPLTILEGTNDDDDDLNEFMDAPMFEEDDDEDYSDDDDSSNDL